MKIEKGQVDILDRSPYRVLSKDVEFADLGLIIIDEEMNVLVPNISGSFEGIKKEG